MYRRPNGSVSRLKLGTYPAVSLADARLDAKRHLGDVEVEVEGRDPVAERQARRDAETFTQLADEYMRRWAKQVDAEGQPRKRTWREDQRKIDTCCRSGGTARSGRSRTGTSVIRSSRQNRDRALAAFYHGRGWTRRLPCYRPRFRLQRRRAQRHLSDSRRS